jgi:hypothetical protein
MTAVIRASMEAGPYARVKHGRAAAAMQHRTPVPAASRVRRRSLQSLHLLLTRLWAHTPSPPQSRQRRLSRLFSQMPAPPQSLQLYLRRLCSQMLVPLQSLHWLLMRLCSQMLAPPQSLHLLLMLLCWQMLAPNRSPCSCCSCGYAGRCWRPRNPCIGS